MSSTITSEKIQKFLDWVNDEGVIFTGIELRYCGPNVGFGFFATKQMRCYENVIKLPKKLMITAGLVADMPEYIPLLKSCRLEPFEVLVLFFCHEGTKKKASKWRPYLEVLPNSFGTPLATCPNMRPEQLPAVFRDLFLKQLDEVEEIYKKLVSILPDLNYDLYLWAWHIVNTRCIYVENPRHPLVDSSKSGDTIAVIPLVDMLNHSPKPQVLPLFDKRSQCYVVNVQSGAVLEGEQLFVCYGPHDNGKLWLEYGFMLPENIHNRVSIPLELFIALTKKLGLEVDDEHISVLREAGLPKLNWREKIYSHESDDEESEEVIERDNLVNDILKQLMASLRSRAEGVDEKLVWLWEEQIDLIQKLVDNKNV